MTRFMRGALSISLGIKRRRLTSTIALQNSNSITEAVSWNYFHLFAFQIFNNLEKNA